MIPSFVKQFLGALSTVSLSGTLFFFSYIEAENDWTSRADGADYIDDLVWLGFKKVAQGYSKAQKSDRTDYSRRHCQVCSVIEGEIHGYPRSGTGTAFQASRISKSTGIDFCDHRETDHRGQSTPRG